MGELILAWVALGIAGGVILHRLENILPAAWAMAALLGPFTLFLAIWEYRACYQSIREGVDRD